MLLPIKSNLGVHHVDPLLSYSLQSSPNVDDLFLGQNVNALVHEDDCTSSASATTAPKEN